jgi:hypothetical protein
MLNMDSGELRKLFGDQVLETFRTTNDQLLSQSWYSS